MKATEQSTPDEGNPLEAGGEVCACDAAVGACGGCSDCGCAVQG